MRCWFLMPACIAVTILFLLVEHKGNHVLAVCLKGLASLIFVVFGFLGSRLCTERLFVNRVLAGLILGCIADVLLNLRFVFPRKKSFFFLFGTTVFLSGHVLYLIALIPKCSCLPACLIADAVLVAFTVFWWSKKLSLTPVYKVFGFTYAVTIMSMVSVAGGVFLTAPDTASAIYFAGAVLFLISDLLLVFNNFSGKPAFPRRVANLELYYIGQLLIGLSLQYIK